MATVSLWLYTPTGTLLQPGVSVASLEWTLQEGAFGVLTATGPTSEIDKSYFQLDARFHVMRSIDGGPFYVEGNAPFLLRYWEFAEDESGAEFWSIEAYTPEYIPSGRIVDTFASTPEVTNPLATKAGNADDVIKEFVDQNMVSATTAARNITMTVEADLSLGQSTTKSASRDNLLDVITDLCEDSNKLGTYLTWGIVYSGDALLFRTWTGQRGVDHTSTSGDPIIVSKMLGNLAQPKTYFDYRTEITCVRALGRGDGSSRMTSRQEDATRSGGSPYAYRESVVETQAETQAALDAEARAELNKGRAIRGFTGKLLDVEGNRYGERVNFGDMVTAEHGGYSYDCHLSRVHGTWDGTEALDIDLEGTATL